VLELERDVVDLELNKVALRLGEDVVEREVELERDAPLEQDAAELETIDLVLDIPSEASCAELSQGALRFPDVNISSSESYTASSAVGEVIRSPWPIKVFTASTENLNPGATSGTLKVCPIHFSKSHVHMNY
jgi:hypothetical protein